MEEKELDFLVGEYLRSWEELGIEDLKGKDLALKSVVGHHQIQPKAPATTLDEIRRRLGNGCGCSLCDTKTNLVFGAGNPKAALMFVGEGPGADEDASGIPFVGRAGQLLTKIIEAMGYTRDQVYIANVVKCRPPENRTPLPDEIRMCTPFLQSQIEVVAPKIIVALGATAAAVLTGTSGPMSDLRGRFHPLCWNQRIQVMPTYHPAYLLRNPDAKKIVWEDMKQVKSQMETKA